MSLPPASITMLLKEYDLAANLHSVSRYISKSVAVRDSGSFKAGNPAQTSSSYVDVTTTSQLTWTSLVVDYNGKFEHSAC
jgi:hypothetical protein